MRLRYRIVAIVIEPSAELPVWLLSAAECGVAEASRRLGQPHYLHDYDNIKLLDSSASVATLACLLLEQLLLPAQAGDE